MIIMNESAEGKRKNFTKEAIGRKKKPLPNPPEITLIIKPNFAVPKKKENRKKKAWREENTPTHLKLHFAPALPTGILDIFPVPCNGKTCSPPFRTRHDVHADAPAQRRITPSTAPGAVKTGKFSYLALQNGIFSKAVIPLFPTTLKENRLILIFIRRGE